MVSELKYMDGVILCGGLGQRLRAELGETQKVMAAVGDRPFLDLLIDYLKRYGLRRFILCTGYKADSVEQYYKENSGDLVFEFSREEAPLGTGGALKNARDFVKSNPFLVLNGDSFCPFDAQSLLEFHQSKSAVASLVVSQIDGREDVGGISLDSDNRIVGFHEKEGKGTHANAGVYCFTQDIFDLMPEDKKFSLEYDFFPKVAGKGVYGFVTEERVFDIGTPGRFQKAKKILKRIKHVEN